MNFSLSKIAGPRTAEERPRKSLNLSLVESGSMRGGHLKKQNVLDEVTALKAMIEYQLSQIVEQSYCSIY